MRNKFRESKYYEDWLKKAKRDFDTAFLNHKYGGYTDTTCYFCHQVAEKVLKSYLLYKGLRYFPKTHILPSLLALCEEKDKEFSCFKQHCQTLDGYYIETKYPAGPPVDYPKAEAQEAIKLAKELLEFVSTRIKI
jgi:HEPN domain-containing protein